MHNMYCNQSARGRKCLQVYSIESGYPRVPQAESTLVNIKQIRCKNVFRDCLLAKSRRKWNSINSSEHSSRQVHSKIPRLGIPHDHRSAMKSRIVLALVASRPSIRPYVESLWMDDRRRVVLVISPHTLRIHLNQIPIAFSI